jgi:hypothetical protein
VKRRLLLILLLLVGGAIVNVAVAWGCATFASLPTTLTPQAMKNEDRVWWRARAPDDFPSDPDWAGVHVARGSALLRLAVQSGGMSSVVAHRLRSGWPTPAMERSHWSSINQFEWRDAWTVDSPVSFSVPLRPIWPGFAINTLFYALILWLLFAAPFVLRRRRRIKRGLCPQCAYPVGASDVCTECGASVASTV